MFYSSLFGKTDDGMLKRLPDDDDDDEAPPAKKTAKLEKATDHLTQVWTSMFLAPERKLNLN